MGGIPADEGADVQITNEIFVLRAPVDTLAVGPAIAFGQGDLNGLRNGEEVRARLLAARHEPVAMPRLRVAFERWRLSDSVSLDDETLIEQIGADVRSGRLVAILLRNAEADLRPGANEASIAHILKAAESEQTAGVMPAEARLSEILKRAVKIGHGVARLQPWDRLTGQSLNRNLTVLTVWTRTHARGPAAIAEAFHMAKGAIVPSLALFESAAATYAVLGKIGRARNDQLLDEAAAELVRAIRLIGVEPFSDILHLASTRGTDGIDPSPPPRDADRRPREPEKRVAAPPPPPKPARDAERGNAQRSSPPSLSQTNVPATAAGSERHPDLEAIAKDPTVAAAIDSSWNASNPNGPGTKQEKGFWVIKDDKTGALSVQQFPDNGTNDSLVPGPVPNEQDKSTVAFFHTHPNTRAEGYVPEPSQADKDFGAALGVPGIVRSHEGMYYFK